MIIPDRKKAATIIISHMMDPHMRKEEEAEGESESGECEALGKELLDAIASKDGMAVYDALKAICLKIDSEPHVEGEHEGEEEEEEY